jgi:hypothetical protein
LAIFLSEVLPFMNKMTFVNWYRNQVLDEWACHIPSNIEHEFTTGFKQFLWTGIDQLKFTCLNSLPKAFVLLQCICRHTR